MLIIEKNTSGYKVRAKEAGFGPNQPNCTARSIREAMLAVEHYFGDEHFSRARCIGKPNCPFCRLIGTKTQQPNPRRTT